MEIAFEEKVDGLEQSELAFMIAALNIQMREHFAPRWLEEPWPCKAYKTVMGLPLGTFWPISILPDIGLDGADGFHAFVAGLAYGRCRWSGKKNDAVTPSHEALELRMDPRANRWVSIGGGKLVALELCDPCQGDTYEVEVVLFGETRKIAVSDFVLPSYFVKDAPRPYTYLDTCDRNVFDLGLSRNGGGYLLTKGKDGTISDYWGRTRFMRKKPPSDWTKDGDELSRHRKRAAGIVGEVVDFRGKISVKNG